MQDIRKNTLNPVAALSHTVKISGMEVNEDSVKEMLDRMGVDPTPEMVQDALGFFSSNGMEINMNNLYDFLKSKQIMATLDARKTTTAVKDLRK